MGEINSFMSERTILLHLRSIPWGKCHTLSMRSFFKVAWYLYDVISPKIDEIMTLSFGN